MLPRWCRDSVTVIRAPYAQYRGTYERDWGHATSHTVGGCSLQPSSTSTDFNDAREAASMTAILYAPADADIEKGDRIQFGSFTFTVNGFAMGWRSPFGGADHIAVNLTEWSG